MPKNKFSFFVVFSLFFGSVFASGSRNKNLSSEMISSYKSGFYPGVVRAAEEILRDEKDSLVAFRAAVYGGESLFRIGRVDDAISLFQNHELDADFSNPESVLLNSQKFYWLGLCYFSQKYYLEAQNKFFASASIFKSLREKNLEFAENSPDYYSISIFYGAKCYFATEDYKKAIPLFEYVISNGQKYSFEDYAASCVQLAQSYNFAADAKRARKCVKLVSSLENENAKFDDETKYSLIILKGEAHENLAEWKNAYDSYCYVLERASSKIAATAMQKAYEVSSSHREEVGEEPGKVLLNAENRLSEYPDLLSEFWTRLAVDAFNEKNYADSLTYFGRASASATSEQKKIAAIYRAEVAYRTASEKSENEEGCKKAIEILSSAEIQQNPIKNNKIQQNNPEKNLDETILLSLARYSGYLKDWKNCEKYAAACMKSVTKDSNPENEKIAAYWIALSKYETGDAASAETTIENYAKKEKLTDKSLLNLLAKSLAKQGKYSEADKIFCSLGEKNQLDNSGILDYSRTLLISGQYDSAKEQSAKASGDEATYISSLASFNQHRWEEAETGFNKILGSKSLGKEYVAYARFYSGYAQYQEGEYEKAISSLNQFAEENSMHALSWSAYMTIARAAAFAKNDGEALSAAKNAVKTARNDKDKNEAVLLQAGILTDGEKYGEALAILEPNLKKRTQFGYECKYKTAEIMVRMGNFSEADAYFSELASLTDKNYSLIAEESAYRRAEIAYSNKDYPKSIRLFEEYGKKFPFGKFKFAANYFSADSLAKTGDETKAILRYLQIVDSSAETSYRYGSEKNLVELYEKSGEIQEAISMATRMVSEYGEQAKNDGIESKIKELKSKTVWNANSEEEKFKLAEKNLESQKNDASQSGEASKNAIYLASAYRSRGENKKAAETYLEAVKYAREAGNDENAARSFYGALEAFDAAAMYADAKATFTELKKLYPESRYTREAEKIAGGL